MKIGFIGLGNMATAMIGGMLQKGIAKPEDIIGSSKTEATAEKVKSKFNINTSTDNKTVATQADVLFLAVKPIFFPEVIAEIKDAVKGDTLILTAPSQFVLDIIKSPNVQKIAAEKVSAFFGRSMQVQFALAGQLDASGKDPMDALLALGEEHSDIMTIK